MSDAPRLVNLQELADLLGTSTNTLRDEIRRAGDAFPVVARGDNGVAYQFDLDQVLAYRRQVAAEAEAEAEARREQLELWRQEIYGADAPGEDAALAGLAPAERRQLAEAMRAEDQVRRLRGELVVKAELEAALIERAAALRQAILQAPARLARRHDLAREVKIALEAELRQALNEFVAGLPAGAGARVDAAA